MKKIIVSLVAIFSYVSVQATVSPIWLKGTVVKGLENCSPFMGLSFLEWGIAEQWYKLCPKELQRQMEEVFKENPEALRDNPKLAKFVKEIGKNSATEDLVMSMFHIAGGSFGLTNADDNPVKYLEPKHIGKILRIVHKWTEASLDPEKIKTLKNEAKDKKAIHKAAIAEIGKETSRLAGVISRAQKLNEEVADRKNELEIKNAKLKEHQTLSGKVVSHESTDFVEKSLQQELNDLCMSFEFKGKNKKLFPEAQWKSFVTSLVGSIQESTGAQRSYAENTPQGILLGFMLKKSNNKDDLQSYFRGLLNNETFVLSPQEEYSSTEMSQTLARKTDASDFEKFSDLLSAFTIKALYEAGLPRITGHQSVNYKGIQFVDCMDTAIRMLANIVTYQPNKNKLGVTPSGLRLNKEAQEFYNSEKGLCADPAEVGNSKVHQAWTNVVSNISGCVYKQIGKGPGSVISAPPEGFDGFMPVDYISTQTASGEIEIDGKSYKSYALKIGGTVYTLAQKKVGNATYLLVPKNSELFCCEIRTNLLNTVIALNKIFDLDLYSKFDDIYEPNFALKKFTQLCEKFNWEPQVDITKLDPTKDMIIPIKVGQNEFSIHLGYNTHGAVTNKNKLATSVNLEVPDGTSQPVIAAIVSAGLKKIRDLPKNLQPGYLYKNVDISTDEKRYQTILSIFQSAPAEQTYLKKLIQSFSFVENEEYLGKIITKVLNPLEDEKTITASHNTLIEFVLSAALIHSLQYKSSTLVFDYLSSFIKYNILTIKEALSLLEKGLDSSLWKVVDSSCREIIALIKEKLVAVGQIAPLMEKAAGNKNVNVQKMFLKEILSLINDKLLTADQVWPIVEEGLKSKDLYNRSHSVNIITALVKEGIATKSKIDQLLPFVEQGLRYSNTFLQRASVRMIESLAEAGMITQSKIESLINLPITDDVKEKLEILKVKAPVSIFKKVKLSPKQTEEIIKRINPKPYEKKQAMQEQHQRELEAQERSEKEARAQKEASAQRNDSASHEVIR